ncbi:MAG: type II toxin-antitoxin system VapC family toxin [Pyrinomonadaceae bacterium]
MKTSVAFWDTSAIVPRCVFQDATTAAGRTRKQFSRSAMWWGSTVEINSSLSRLKRSGLLEPNLFAAANRKLRDFHRPARIIRPTNSMLEIAAELPERFGLRSLDAFQLASALIWCGGRPRNRPFVCADKRLSKAAEDAGFQVIFVI